MNISILLPYKENFSPAYPGAVSLFVYETTRISKLKKFTTVYGNTFSRNWQKLDKVDNKDVSEAMLVDSRLNCLMGTAGCDLKVKNNARTYYLYGVDSNLTHKMDIGETKHKIDEKFFTKTIRQNY